MTRIDPLYFVLREIQSTKEGHTWQPLDQLNISQIVQNAITDSKQWKHVCGVKKLGDDLVLYKFVPEKALEWLVKKQEAAYSVVCQQVLQSKNSQRRATEKLMSEGGGAYSNTFRLAQDEEEENAAVYGSGTNTISNSTTSSPTSDLSPMEHTAAKEASVQIVCEYLSPEWQSKLRTHLHMTLCQREETADTTTETTSKKRRAAWEANPGQDDADDLLQFTMGTGSTKDDAFTNKKEPPTTAGLKRLAKVNTKGMKSLSNFFGAAKKKKTA